MEKSKNNLTNNTAAPQGAQGGGEVGGDDLCGSRALGRENLTSGPERRERSTFGNSMAFHVECTTRTLSRPTSPRGR